MLYVYFVGNSLCVEVAHVQHLLECCCHYPISKFRSPTHNYQISFPFHPHAEARPLHSAAFLSLHRLFVGWFVRFYFISIILFHIKPYFVESQFTHLACTNLMMPKKTAFSAVQWIPKKMFVQRRRRQ